jgi:hypothetical protein
MKDRDHNEAMVGMFQAEPRFAADYLRQVLADVEPADVRAGLRQMADVLRVSQAAAPTDSAPSAGLFDRAGVRYEVACDVIGALIAHYAEIMGLEREQAQPNEAVLRVAGAMKAALAGERDDLDPRDSAVIEAAMLVDCFLAALAYPDHTAELAMFDNLPSAARMAVGRFFSFFLAGGLDDAGRKKLHPHMLRHACGYALADQGPIPG